VALETKNGGEEMKPRKLSCVIATIFITAALPVRLAAQQQSVNPQQKHPHHRYKLVDIGTFGGPESNVNPSVNAGPIVSRQGTTVGASATSVPTSSHSHPFVCGGLDGTVPFVFHGFEWQDSGVTDLGALQPTADNCSEAQGVNARGEIVLQSENGEIDPLTGINEIRGVLWKNGKLEDLGTFGGNNSLANQINSRGQIAGAALNTVPDPFSIYYFLFLGSSNGTQTRAFLWENGHKKDLGTLGGPDAVATFVNELGQVAGSSYTSSTVSASGLPTMDPFLWTKNEGMIDLGSFGGTSGGPNSLNNRGQVIGSSNLAGDQGSDPFLWDHGKLIDLFTDSIGGNPVTADAINDAGEIVGAAAFPTRPFDAYLWKDGVATDLGSVDGDGCSWAHAINSRSQIVGQSFACDGSTGHTFLWENGSMVDLNSLIPANSSLQLVDAQAINDRGEIAGDGLPPGCTLDAMCGHAFVLIPCDSTPDNEGCEDVADMSIAAGSMPFVQRSIISAQSAVTASEIAGRIRSQFGRTRGFAPWLPK
jgi:probable HAF family extracellular repeat protein